MIRGVIFDMDGVMIDSERQSNEGWLWAAEQLGVEMPMWLIDSFKGAPNTLSCQFFDNYYHGKIDYWEARKLRTEHIYKIREKEGLPIKKGLFELLDYIRENGIKCAVATSTRRESAEKTLHTIGAWEYLDNVVYGDSVEHGKPEPDIFLSAADRIGVPPQECIVIEDSINGIKAGHAAGMKVVHVPDTIQIDDTIRALTYCVCEHLGERAVRQLCGLSVPLRSCALYGIMVNNFHIFHQIASFQIRLSGQHNASLVNNFHVRSFHAASSTRTQMYRA